MMVVINVYRMLLLSIFVYTEEWVINGTALAKDLICLYHQSDDIR